MFVKIAETDAEKLACFPVLKELRSHLVESEFMPQLARQATQGYQLAFIAANTQTVAVAGFWLNETFSYGKYMYVYDLVTSTNVRRSGYGRALVAFLKGLAKNAGCKQLHLDSGVQRFQAHKFYLREGFIISGHHFAMDLN